MQAGATYQLQTDVTTSGTALIALADGISFDLNGYTVTYGNSIRSWSPTEDSRRELPGKLLQAGMSPRQRSENCDPNHG